MTDNPPRYKFQFRPVAAAAAASALVAGAVLGSVREALQVTSEQ